jgi:hypothetical protein
MEGRGWCDAKYRTQLSTVISMFANEPFHMLPYLFPFAVIFPYVTGSLQNQKLPEVVLFNPSTRLYPRLVFVLYTLYDTTY